MNIFKNLFSKDRPKTLADNDSFIRLIKVAQKDENTRIKLKAIVSADHTKRQSTILALISEMRANGTPEDFIEAISSLSNNDVAKKVAEAIEVKK